MPVVIEEMQTTITGAENPQVVMYKILIEDEEIETHIPVTSIVIDREVNKIPAAVITIVDGDVSTQTFSLSNEERFLPGKKIEIRMGYQEGAETLFKGMIVSHGNRIADRSTSLIINCRDAAVKMTLQKKYAHFNDITDSDLAEQIIGTYEGLEKEVEATTITHKNLVQYNLTDWDFLLYRFDMLGLFCLPEDGKLVIKKPDLQKERVLDVVYGATLMEYQATIDARLQSSETSAASWDFTSQSVNNSAATEPSLQEAGNITHDTLAENSGFESNRFRFAGKWTEAELKALADAKLQKQRLAKIRGKVKFQGTHLIKPGEFIALGGVGDRFSGPLYVSAVHHAYESGNWLSEVQLGLEPAWFAEKLSPYHPTATQGIVPSIQGLQVGVVTDIEDPEGEFRIRVKMPAVNADEQGVWARVVTLDAGSNRGTFFRPEVDDEVIVGFLGDDPRQVVVLGMLHSSAKAAPLQPAAANNEKGYVSRSEFKFIFNDEKKSLTIQSPAGKKIVIDEEAGKILIEDENGNKITMGSSEVKVDSAANLSLKAGGQLKIEAPSISINGSGTTEIKGGMVKIN
jgi:Rhs element Vgr protein